MASYGKNQLGKLNEMTEKMEAVLTMLNYDVDHSWRELNHCAGLEPFEPGFESGR